MKYRLVELLSCIRCHGNLDVSGVEVRSIANVSPRGFSCTSYCARYRTETLPQAEQCDECGRIEIVTGILKCRECGYEFPVLETVPCIFEQPSGMAGRLLSETTTLYSHLWTASLLEPGHETERCDTIEGLHVDAVEEALQASVVQGTIGLEAGCGSGRDTAAMATRHPALELISLDMSEGVFEAKRRTAGLSNVHIVRASVLSIPLRSDVCDFGYSFGVLHHTTDPTRGLQEIVRVLRGGGHVSLYLYEDHSDNRWKSIPVTLVAVLRLLTTKLNVKLLSCLCYLLSPFVVVIFSIPARVMGRFDATRVLAEKMPFNFATSLFSVHGDLMDRFGAPIEIRYNRETLTNLLRSCCLQDIYISKLRSVAGWVARGVK